MSATEDRELHANLNAPEYHTLLEKIVNSTATIKGAQIINLADGVSLAAGASDPLLAEGTKIMFGQNPAACKSPMQYLPTAIDEIVIRVNDKFAVSCGSPDNQQFFFIIEDANAGLSNAVNAMQTLISGGPEALQRKGGLGMVVDRDNASHFGVAAEDESQSATPDPLSSPASVLNLYGLSEDGTASAALQHLVDRGRVLKQFQASGADGSYGFCRIPFAPDHVVILQCAGQCPPQEMEKLLGRLSNDVLRRIIHHILDAEDFNADTDLPENDAAFNKIIDELRALPKDDLKNRLIVGGFANHSLGEAGDMDDGAMVLRCRECIYFLPHQRWCDLPELPVPVEADWYCRLWKL